MKPSTRNLDRRLHPVRLLRHPARDPDHDEDRQRARQHQIEHRLVDAQVDARQVERVTRKYLVPGRMQVIAVGDRARIEPQLRKLNLGAIALRSARSQVGR